MVLGNVICPFQVLIFPFLVLMRKQHLLSLVFGFCVAIEMTPIFLIVSACVEKERSSNEYCSN